MILAIDQGTTRVGTGQWTTDEIARTWPEKSRYEPPMTDTEREALPSDWRRALDRSREWDLG